MSDVFLVFNRIAQGAQRWNDFLPGTKDVMFFRVGQKQSIFAAPGTNYTQLIPHHQQQQQL